MMKKKCVYCNKELSISEFNKNPRLKDGFNNNCKNCVKTKTKKWREENKERIKKYRLEYFSKNQERIKGWSLKEHFGINVEDYKKLLKFQSGRCKICGSTSFGRKQIKYFCVDHDHETGKIRGLLCHHCNTALGSMKDNIENLKNMIAYLEQSKVHYSYSI